MLPRASFSVEDRDAPAKGLASMCSHFRAPIVLNCPDQCHLGPPSTHPQLVALRTPFKLSPELCCECACLQPRMDSALAISRVVEGLLKEHLSLLLCPDAVALCEGEVSGAAPDSSSPRSSCSLLVLLASHH